jgi:hypothetical protein
MMRAAHRVSLRGDGVRRIVTRADNRRESCAKALSAFTITEFIDLSGSIPATAGEIKT